MKRPNIIFILTDQQRYDTLGCYGQQLNITPNLDELADQGVRFEYAFSNQPVCGPARSIIQTGEYATETGCYRNGIALPLESQTLAKGLSKNGYKVGYIGKWHLASTTGRSKETKLNRVNYTTSPIPPEFRGGFKDYWLASDLLEFTSHSYEGHLFDIEGKKRNFEGYRVERLTDFALEYLELQQKNHPFFLFLSHLEPHQQNDHNAIEGPRGSKEKFKNFHIPGDLKKTEGDWKENFPDYLGCCNSIDENIGRIIRKLKELNLYSSTLIIFTSDHGCHFRTRNGEYKRSCHEASIRIPLIISGPDFSGGKVISELVSLIDLPPTILQAVGIKTPSFMKGHQLQSLTKKQNSEGKWPKEIFIQISESQVGRAIRTKKWKYSIKAPKKDGILYSKSNVYEDDFLYDLKHDPFEKHNLINDSEYIKIKKTLSDLLIEKMVEAGEIIPSIKFH